MVRRRVTKRKKSARFPGWIQRENRFASAASTSSKDIDKSLQQAYRPHEHPYATRSKTLRNTQSSMNVHKNDCPQLKRRQSDSSIVFLGTYRKVPQLVVLDESSEGRCIEFVEKPEAMICLKTEKMDCTRGED